MTPPRTLVLDLSDACNLRCLTCRCPAIDRAAGRPTLDLGTVVRVIDEFADLGGREVAIFGGEPLLVRHVYDVVEHAAARGLAVELTTNGTPATRANAARLLAGGLSAATVSLDGGRTGHDRVRGPGTFDRAFAGARHLSWAAATAGRPGFRLNLHATVSRANADSFADLVRHAADLDPPPTVSVAYFSRVPDPADRQAERLLGLPVVGESSHWTLPEHLLVTPEQVPALAAEVAAMKQLAREQGVDLRVDPALDDRLDPAGLVSGTFRLGKRCDVFDTTIIVGPSGEIGACPMLTHHSFAHSGDTSLAAAWSSDGPFRQVRERLRDGYLPVCGHCCNHAELM